MRKGVDEELISKVTDISNLPIVASGGVGSINDVINILNSNISISGIAIASCFHYYYLNNLLSAHKEGNQDYLKGIRDKFEKHSFSIEELKKKL